LVGTRDVAGEMRECVRSDLPIRAQREGIQVRFGYLLGERVPRNGEFPVNSDDDRPVALVRSTHRGPVKLPSPRDEDDEWGEASDDWRMPWATPEILSDEDPLVDPEEEDRSPDEYEHQWYRAGSSRDPINDSPVWEGEIGLPCTRCGERDDVDPLGTCSGCRDEDRRCSWCGLDPSVYSSDGSCRTCYQRLRRTRVTSELRLRLSMLDAAFRRADLRKRRLGAPRD